MEAIILKSFKPGNPVYEIGKDYYTAENHQWHGTMDAVLLRAVSDRKAMY